MYIKLYSDEYLDCAIIISFDFQFFLNGTTDSFDPCSCRNSSEQIIHIIIAHYMDIRAPGNIIKAFVIHSNNSLSSGVGHLSHSTEYAMDFLSKKFNLFLV